MANRESPRPYAAERRRERAERERLATQRRVIEAAGRLFRERGYVATTMNDIAKEAGVALQSVYNAGRSKSDLLHLVTDVAVGGDDRDVTLLDRPNFAAIAAEPDAVRQIELIAALIASTLERVAPVWIAYREAAAVDAKAAANLVAAHRRRHETFAGMIAMILPDGLRLAPDDATSTAWAIGSVDVFLLVREQLGWDSAKYADWLRRTLVRELLDTH
jgi:AcrR family transcriptional regulator